MRSPEGDDFTRQRKDNFVTDYVTAFPCGTDGKWGRVLGFL